MKTILLALLATLASFAIGADEARPPGTDITPPRLSFIDGEASFWRSGAQDWAPARINTPLVAGDALFTGERANLEIQIGARAFVRAAEKTQVGIVNLEPDFLQVKVTSGHASLDLRSVAAGHTVELDTPNAVFTIENPGYYRVVVAGNVTHFITRRGGRATIALADGEPQRISPSEEIVVGGTGAPTVETYVAPELDAWDRWNYARTDAEIDALSARYVSPGIYGVGALDQWGAWRVVPAYGPVWVPEQVPAGWAPYTTGSWLWDPYYGWTWVDVAPWGWAPFHYGRWVYVGGFWGWAPGPTIVRPLYAPALVAFFGVAPGVSVRIGLAGPAVGWVALGWGEPLRPWWGRPGFAGVPWWGGWGGPRVVNKVVIERTTVVNVNTIVYEHTRTPRALVAIDDKHFGDGPVRGRRFQPADMRELQRIGDAHPVQPGPASLAPGRGQTTRPPAALASRPVLASRAPREAPLPWKRDTTAAAPAPRLVPPPKHPDTGAALPRPSFGQKGPERARPTQPPRFEELQRTPPAVGQRAPERRAPAGPSAVPRAAPRAPQGQGAHEARALPGRPANGLFPRQTEQRGITRSHGGGSQ